MKNLSFFILFFFLTYHACYAQSVSVGTITEEVVRRNQIRGQGNDGISFLVRPLTFQALTADDSLSQTGHFLSGLKTMNTLSFAKGKGRVYLLPAMLKQQHNSHHPYGWNDGSMVPAKGYQMQLSMGIAAKLGPLSIQFQPEFVFAQNAGFATFSEAHRDSIARTYYAAFVNTIDNPERYGQGIYTKFFPGQSSIRLNLKKFSVGLSTENMWWGPGMRNALIMSNNAPGFPHLTLNTTAPVSSPIGSFEGQLVSGYLKKSGLFPPDTSRASNGEPLYTAKPEGDRYLNGIVLTWQPKWTKGLYLGFSRVFYLYRSNVKPTFNGYLPVIGQLFKGSGGEAEQEDAKKRDQLLSFFFRLVLPKEKAEIYAEFGRNDHSGDARDLLLETEHSRAYTIGFRKLFEASATTDVELMAELTTLQKPSTLLVRAQEIWYAHYQVRDGYTNRGQVMGAGIGPGGSSQTVGINLLKGVGKTGVQLERVVHNNDFYFTAFAPTREFMRHWVDLSIQLNKSWQHKRFLFDARLTWVKSLNYQWQEKTDIQNLSSGLSLSYLFGK